MSLQEASQCRHLILFIMQETYVSKEIYCIQFIQTERYVNNATGIKTSLEVHDHIQAYLFIVLADFRDMF